MSEAQAKKKDCYRYMSSELPGSDDLYLKMDEISEEMCVSKSLSWEKKICMTKKNFLQLARDWSMILFPPYSTFLRTSKEITSGWLVLVDDVRKEWY